MGLFQDWGVTNFTLKRKDSKDYTGRTYMDYLKYKIQNSNIVTTEMNTVYNNQTGQHIQTFIFENTSFMIGILHQNKTADSISESLNKLQDKLQIKNMEIYFQYY